MSRPETDGNRPPRLIPITDDGRRRARLDRFRFIVTVFFFLPRDYLDDRGEFPCVQIHTKWTATEIATGYHHTNVIHNIHVYVGINDCLKSCIYCNIHVYKSCSCAGCFKEEGGFALRRIFIINLQISPVTNKYSLL